MKTSDSTLAPGTTSGENLERYEVINGVRVERALIGAFELAATAPGP